LQENLVQPYRWRYWDELAGSASPYEKFEKSSELNLNQPRTEDPLDLQLQKVNQAISNFPTKGNADGNSNSDFNIPEEGSLPPDSTGTFQYEDWSPTETATERSSQPTTAPQKTKTLPKAAKQPAAKPAKQSPKSEH
jgi:hypothetical protein